MSVQWVEGSEMLQRHKKLMSTIQVFLISALVLLTILIVALQVIRSRQGFDKLAKKIRIDYIAGQKALIKQEVLRVTDMVNFHRSQRDKETRDIVRRRVYEAYAIAEHLYQQNKDRKSQETIKELISEALRTIRYNNGLGYYFITRQDGLEILFADRPDMEGKNLLKIQDTEGRHVVQDMIEIVKKGDEGFYEYIWTKPGSSQPNHRKISYIKHFEPFDWIIGTGLYVEDVEAQIQSEVLKEISLLRFGDEGYVFVNTMDGNALITNGKLLPGDKKLWQLNPTKSESLKTLFEKEYAAALKPEGDYIYYNFQKLSHPGEEFPKASFIFGIPEWNWLIGAGVYLDEAEAVVKELQNTLKQDRQREVSFTILTAIIALFAFLTVFKLISLSYINDYNLFLKFFKQASTDDKEIDCDLVRYTDLRQMAKQANKMLHEKQSAKLELKNEKEHFQELLEYLPVGVFEADLDLNLTYVNRKALAIFGYTTQDLSNGLNGLDMFIPEERPKVRANITKRIESIHSDISEYIAVRKDGTTFPVISHSSLVESEGKAVGIRGFIADISERKDREEEQLKLKKLESIGIFAGGIAHDFNNLLAGLFGNIEMATRSLPKDHKARRYLKTAGQSLKDSTNLTQQLLTFAKGGEPIREVISIGKLLQDAAQFFLRGSNVKLKTEIATGLYPVYADKGQLHQVISNLVINARQAMPEGGALLLTADNCVVDERPEISISFRDQGTGIAPQYLDKVFDPYFTTKQQGSGLGLASCYSIIKKHDGRITVKSELNRGTTFTIYLPAASLENEEKSHSEAQAITLSNGEPRRARVLLMDDEDTIREVCGEMLKEMGHQVSYAIDGDDALTKFRAALSNGRAFDIVISDLTIPGGMGGQELTQKIIHLNPQAKIIVSSGYANDPVMANYREYGFCGRVNKPYHFDELQNVIEKQLN